MEIHEIEAIFRSKVVEHLRLEPEGINRFRVFNPFVFDDGDHLSIVLKREGEDWVISDEGNTYMRLTYRMEEKSFSSGTRQKIISDAIEMFGLEDRDGEIMISIPEQELGDALYSFVQGVLRISDTALLSRERVNSAFMEDLRGFLADLARPEVVTWDWHHPVYDPQGMYKVDCYLNGQVRPTAVFGLPTDSKVRDATITLLKLEGWQPEIRSIAVFEDQEAIGRAVLARFTDVCDKQFSSLAANKMRLLSYLQAIGAARSSVGN